jgi:uncharacterized protein (TIGR03083 family)
MAMAAGTIPSIEAVRAQARRMEALVTTFTPADLEKPTPCKGWLVRDIVAHTTSGAERLGEDYLRAIIEGRPTRGYDLKDQTELNQAGVDKYRNEPDLPGRFSAVLAQVLPLLDEIEVKGLAHAPFQFFAEMTVEQWPVCSRPIWRLISGIMAKHSAGPNRPIRTFWPAPSPS